MCVAWPGVAAATPDNSASSSAFIAAVTRIETRAVALHGREQASAEALVEHVRATCPGVLPSRAQSVTAAQLRVLRAFVSEAGYELSLAWVRPLRSAVRLDVSRMSRLHWTDKALNQGVHDLLRTFRATLSLRPPDLCSEAKLASASDFEAIPPRTKAFLHNASLALPDSAPSVVDLANRMKGYLPSSDSGALMHLERLYARGSRLAAPLLKVWGNLLAALAGP